MWRRRRWLLETGYRHLPVMEDDQLLGIVSIRDLLWAILAPGTAARDSLISAAPRPGQGRRR